MIEFALTLPIFLCIILFFLAVGTFYNARTSLSSAVGMVRSAYTRGDSTLVGDAVIPEVAAWRSGGSCKSIDGFGQLAKLLATPDQVNEAFSESGHYHANALYTFGHCLDEAVLPASYIYAQVYALQYMRQSVGEVRFPCDPNTPDGIGCLRCINLNPSSTTTEPGEPFPDDIDFNREWVGLECEYRPGGSILGPLQRLLSFITGTADFGWIVIRRRQIFQVN